MSTRLSSPVITESFDVCHFTHSLHSQGAKVRTVGNPHPLNLQIEPRKIKQLWPPSSCTPIAVWEGREHGENKKL